MSGKFFLYVAVTFLVIWAMDSVNINQIFKKNKILHKKLIKKEIQMSLMS